MRSYLNGFLFFFLVNKTSIKKANHKNLYDFVNIKNVN